jgi:hypothetical protein
VRFRTGRMPHTLGLRWGGQIIADAVRGSRRATARPAGEGASVRVRIWEPVMGASGATLKATHGCP